MKKFLVTVALVVACGGDAAPGETAASDTLRMPQVQPVADPGAAGDSGATMPGPSAPLEGGARPAGGTGAPASHAPAPAPGAPVNEPAVAPPAQQGDEGAAILRRASSAYEGVRTLKADFVMSFTNPLTRQNGTSRGTLYQRRPDRIALRFTQPAGDLLVSDGQYFWQYYPSVDANQATRMSASAGDQSRVDLQAQFLGNPVERFNYTLHAAENVGGRSTNVLTLVPKTGGEYRSLKVWIDTRDNLARRFEITERNGVVRRFDLSNMETNGSIPESVFRFTAPDGVRVINAG